MHTVLRIVPGICDKALINDFIYFIGGGVENKYRNIERNIKDGKLQQTNDCFFPSFFPVLNFLSFEHTQYVLTKLGLFVSVVEH